MGNGSHHGRSLWRGQFQCGGRRRLSEYQRHGGQFIRTPGWDLVLRTGMERADAVEDRVRIRAGNQGAEGAEISAHGGFEAWIVRPRELYSNLTLLIEF